MQEYLLTKKQARQFMLLKHGLIDEYKFAGKQGILGYVNQVGCIQFDPIDVCGKNAELVLQSRVKGFKKQMLYDLLYNERKLIDYFDKCLSIMQTSDWCYFKCYRDYHKSMGISHAEVNAVCDEIKQIIKDRGAVSSKDIGFDDKVNWYWSNTKLSRAALETLYFRGDLVVHHKNGTNKYYDLAENCIPSEILNAPYPFANELEHLEWRVFRRIGAVGMLWNKASDAWVNIGGLKANERNLCFAALLKKEKIIECTVIGITDKLYLTKDDIGILEYVMANPKFKNRCEFIAPLDNIMWDRRLINALFGFEYKWEIYTPEQ